MAEKKAKTAEKNVGEIQHRHRCAQCGGDGKVTLFTGFGRKGFYLVCEKNSNHIGRLR
jgi:hypothetical protein